jgi:GAF domain-containing protein
VALGSLDDPSRLEALRATRLLDSEREEAFDRFTRLVALLLDAPTALVSLVDHDRLFFKSAIGLREPWDARRTAPLTHTLCRHVVLGASPLVVPDVRRHPFAFDSPQVHALGIGAYAGAPLMSLDGHVLGTLCAIDARPRAWTEKDVVVLGELASAVMTEVDLHAKTLARIEELERLAGVAEVRRPSAESADAGEAEKAAT